MKNIIHRLSVLAAAAMLSASALLSTTSLAANTKDVYWQGGHGYTERKDNDSSVYVKNDSPNQVSVSVYGVSYINGITVHNYVSNLNGYPTLNTIGVKVPGQCERVIRQYIKEKGYNEAYISFVGNNTSGYWSADTANQWLYTPAN